jgi:hypothetical protein
MEWDGGLFARAEAERAGMETYMSQLRLRPINNSVILA